MTSWQTQSYSARIKPPVLPVISVNCSCGVARRGCGCVRLVRWPPGGGARVAQGSQREGDGAVTPTGVPAANILMAQRPRETTLWSGSVSQSSAESLDSLYYCSDVHTGSNLDNDLKSFVQQLIVPMKVEELHFVRQNEHRWITAVVRAPSVISSMYGDDTLSILYPFYPLCSLQA